METSLLGFFSILGCALFIPGGAFFIPRGCLIHPHPALIIPRVGLNWSLGMNRCLYLITTRAFFVPVPDTFLCFSLSLLFSILSSPPSHPCACVAMTEQQVPA